MVDVARHAGVSLKTVSRVINDAPHVQQALVDKVLALAAELGFRPNRLASTLRSGQPTATIGLLIEEIANPFYATIADVTAEVARAHDTLLITASSEEDPAARASTAPGSLFATGGRTARGAGRGRPLIPARRGRDGNPGGLPRPAGVRTDRRHRAAGQPRRVPRGRAERCSSAGHRRIAILLDSIGVYTMRERLAGAREALAQAGIALDEDLVRDGVREPVSAAKATAEMLDRTDPPTAFFTLNNRITVGALQELWRRGNDAALVGFDDFELSHLMPRPLTVVALRRTRVRAHRGRVALRTRQPWPERTAHRCAAHPTL